MINAKLAEEAARGIYKRLLSEGAKASTLYKLEQIIAMCSKGDDYVERHRMELMEMMVEVKSEDPALQVMMN